MVQRHTRKTRTIEVWLLDTNSIASGHKANQEKGKGREGRGGGGRGEGYVGGVGNVEVGGGGGGGCEWEDEYSSIFWLT